MNHRLLRGALDVACGVGRNRRLLIFTFHRVLPAHDPLLRGEPSREDFATRLEWIRDCLNVLPLPEAARRLSDGGLPARAACVTFDDGYRNNAEIARPLLDAKGIPASFFIATGAIDRGAMWNDLVIEAARACGDRLDLQEFGLGSWDVRTEDERPTVLGRVLDTLKYEPFARRAAIADALYARYCGGESPNLMMTESMVRDLARNGHDVGAHTMTHPILRNIDEAAARAEIDGSRDWVARVTGTRPKCFAYPNGRPGVDFDERHIAMVGAAGFDCAVSTTWGAATRRSNRFSLERFTPWEGSRAGFVSRILKTYASSFINRH
jgi:peptidoglycan/xylan/chitin deacetylase (PgdA/CDA1 family)